MPAKKILVADDSLTIQKVIRLALSNEGYDIQAVSDGNDAVQQIAVFRPDVVLVDVSLPGKSAFEVKRATDAEPSSAHVRFVLMSSAFERVDEQQVKELQFHGQLTKPFDPAHLRKVLSDVLASAPAPTRVSSAPAHPPRAPQAQQFQAQQFQAPPFPSQPAMQPSTQSDEAPPLPPSPDEMPAMDSPAMDSMDDLPPPPPSLGSISIDLPAFDAPPAPPALPSQVPQQEKAADDDLWNLGNPPPPVPSMEPGLPPMPNFGQDLPPELPPETPRAQDDSDIRHLTESTIRMSGLDDFDWSVNEPSLKPSQDMADLSSANFPFDSPPQQTGRELPPLPAASIPLSNTPTDFSFGPPEQTLTETLQLGIDSDAPGNHAPQSKGFQGVSKEAVEQIIQKEVQAALEKVAQRILPEIAERVIKQEIHRLLSEQP